MSDGATLLDIEIRTHILKRTIPGHIEMGAAGLAESIGKSLSRVRKELKELQSVGRVLIDPDGRRMFATGAVLADPPTTPQSTIAMARQWIELPKGPIADLILSEILHGLREAGRENLLETWKKETGPVPDSVTPHSVAQSTAHCDTHRASLPSPGPLSVDPLSEDPPTAAAYRDAWGLLPKPPFAEAAAADFRSAVEIPIGEFETLIEALFCSKWVDGQLHTPPTLRRMVQDLDYRDRVMRGEFARMARTDIMHDVCNHRHGLFEACPSPRPCGRYHDRGYCAHCYRLERETAARESQTCELAS